LSVSALVLDYGNVLTYAQPPDHLARMAELAGMPVDAFVSAYWRHRDDYDRGLEGREFWRRVLGAASISDAVAASLVDADGRAPAQEISPPRCRCRLRTARRSEGDARAPAGRRVAPSR
jgi:hypothetical protein